MKRKIVCLAGLLMVVSTMMILSIAAVNGTTSNEADVKSEVTMVDNINVGNILNPKAAMNTEVVAVNDVVTTNITDSINSLASKTEQEEMQVKMVSAIADKQEATAIAENEARKAEEAKKAEEARKAAEAKKIAEAQKAVASDSGAPEMTFTASGDAVFTYNVYAKSNLTVDQFNQMLKNTALAGCGQSFYNMENTYNVNGVVAVGIACHESANGYRTANTYNYWGRKGKSGWMAFSSKDQSIMSFGEYLNSSMYKGKSLSGIGSIYCPGTSASWESHVKTHMKEKWAKISF